MPTLDWNKDVWAGSYSWENEGEEWSEYWGSSEAQWYACLFPRIHSFIGCDNILEIAPGYGRWTKFLLPFSKNTYRAVDLAQSCVDACNDRFTARHPDFKALVNDGVSLECVSDRKYDFIFSFDSLVHCDLKVLGVYIKQILKMLLEKNGVCFIHHSNLKYAHEKKIPLKETRHFRDPTVSASEVKQIIEASGGKVLLQELIEWSAGPCMDALTTFTRADAIYEVRSQELVLNPVFLEVEANYIKRIMNLYCFYK